MPFSGSQPEALSVVRRPSNLIRGQVDANARSRVASFRCAELVHACSV